MAGFSAAGVTPEGFSKPDLVAPGVDIIAALPNRDKLTISREHPSHRVDQFYFRMSGTSMAAPIVSGAAALLLESEPHLTPDQVKYRLMATANQNWPGYDEQQAGAGMLDIWAALQSNTTESANTGLPASQMLWTGSDPVAWNSVNWSSVNWSSVNWSSVNWSSVNWSSVNWSSVNWSSDYWDE
jgi:serine protease AprX